MLTICKHFGGIVKGFFTISLQIQHENNFPPTSKYRQAKGRRFRGICLYDCFIYRSSFVFRKCLESRRHFDVPGYRNQSKLIAFIISIETDASLLALAKSIYYLLANMRLGRYFVVSLHCNHQRTISPASRVASSLRSFIDERMFSIN